MIGYIPENVNLYPYLTGIENLDYFANLLNLITQQGTCKFFNEMITISSTPKKFQITQKNETKVILGILTAKKAKIYLLDEPNSGLDPLSSNEFLIIKAFGIYCSTILILMIYFERETCNKIGIPKNGKLLKEMDSQMFVQELEDIYIKFMKD